MGERVIDPILNVHDNYHKVNIINSYWGAPFDPLVNTFTPTGDQLWSNAANWSQGHVPTSTETAMIDGGNIILDVISTVSKLVVATGRTLTSDNAGRMLTVLTDVNCSGTIDFTSSNAHLKITGSRTNNYINTFIRGNSTVTYLTNSGSFNILNLDYHNLIFTGSQIVTLDAHLITTGNLTNTGTLHLGAYNLEVGGNFQNGGGTLTKLAGGTVRFVGNCQMNYATLNFSGNPDVELNKLFEIGQTTFTTGTGTYTFRSVAGSGVAVPLYFQTGIGTPTVAFNGNIVIAANTQMILGLGLTLAAGKSILGADPTSNFTNRSWLTLRTFIHPMSTGGTLDVSHTSNKMIYGMAGDYTVPITTFGGALSFEGTGTKRLSGHTTCYTFEGGTSTVDLESYNLTTTATSASSNISGMSLYKTGSGHLLFNGPMSIGYSTFYFTGNPTIDFKGSVTFNSLDGNGANMNWGTGLIRVGFSAGKAFILNGVSGAQTMTFNNPIEIIGAYEFTINSGINITLNNTITGDNAASKLINKSALTLKNAAAPMAIGLFDANVAANTVIYGLAGNQDVKAGTYRTLTLNGSGAKKLLGNVSVVNVYTLTAPATLDSNGFALTNP